MIINGFKKQNNPIKIQALNHKNALLNEDLTNIYAGIRIIDSINETILCFKASEATIKGSLTKG